MSKKMRGSLVAFDIVHPNFPLKVSLFFFDRITFTNYKIHYKEDLDELYRELELDQKTFVLSWITPEIRLHEPTSRDSELGAAGTKKVFKKLVVATADEKYRNFDVESAEQTYDIIGKHISEFKRADGDTIPEIFYLLFNYFEQNEVYIKTEGVFRLAGNKKLLQEIEKEMKEGNYEFLTSIEDPLTVGVYLKKVLREMGEPLWTFDLYTRFKDINDENWKDQAEKIEAAKELLSQMPPLNRDTFNALLKFLHKFTEFGEYNKMKTKNLAIVFAPNLFKGYETTPNDMIYAQVLVKTLELMIDFWI